MDSDGDDPRSGTERLWRLTSPAGVQEVYAADGDTARAVLSAELGCDTSQVRVLPERHSVLDVAVTAVAAVLFAADAARARLRRLF
jgi:hypothetical protein